MHWNYQKDTKHLWIYRGKIKMIDNRFMSLRFPDEEGARDFVLAALGADAYEKYEKLRKKYNGKPDWGSKL